MSQLTILRYPDPRLHTVAKPVAAVDARLRKLADDMFETMYEAAGIGLAATQVDVHERLITIDVSEDRDQPMVLINPEIVWASEETRVGDEGCLSVPGIYDGVERSTPSRSRPWTWTANRRSMKPKACWRSASSMKWTTCWARCLWNTSPP
jgi:peptide deformylase